jgi:hypothetical protein
MKKNFLKKIKNLILGKKETQDIIENVEEFTNLTATYNKLLKQQIKQKEKRISKIRVLVNDFKIPIPTTKHNLDIQLVDMKNTRIKRRGKGSQKKTMDWEKKFQEMSGKNRGVMI